MISPRIARGKVPVSKLHFPSYVRVESIGPFCSPN